MELNSKDIKQGEIIGEAHRGNGEGCRGENLSPELHWSDVPEGTKSFAVTVFDPDVDTECGWWHWQLYNIPADIRSLPRGAGNPSLKLAPKESIQGLTDLAEYGFHGVLPDIGDDVHNYRFSVCALDTELLDVPKASIVMPAEISYLINKHLIKKTTITSPFQR